MKVDFNRVRPEPPEQSQTARSGQPAGQTEVAASRTNSTAGSDQAQFSFDQARVQSLQAQVLAHPEVREAKVRLLQQAISKGEYAVPASQVAEAMIRDHSAA